MTHWLLEELDDTREKAIEQANRALIFRELLNESSELDVKLLSRSAEALEMVVLDLVFEDITDNEEKQKELKRTAADAFRLLRALPRPTDPLDAGKFLLRAGTLAVLGDRGFDAARWLREQPWSDLPVDSEDWSKRTWATVLDIWLRLIRKDGWSDRDAVLERISSLRDAQSDFEKDYLEELEPAYTKANALELIGLYHLAKAAEIFAYYMTDGVVERNYQIRQLLDTHFDRVMAVCEHAQMVELEPMSRLLAAGASQMAENSIWTVTRAVNSRVTQFVESLVDQGRGDRAIFDVLPPQRRTLAEKGLLGSSRRAVVVSLPTSSGKTLIAEFRILQALNQFDQERGWVVYLVPTRTLVNQITRQLRRDLEPLGIIVEQVSPALEIDNVESDLLSQSGSESAFRVLVTTPEKLDLMLRQGWEKKIDRPLTLVIVDEAHNIQNTNRGLKLELLLATINSECRRAQFLLLTPFIDNAREVARWLGGQNAEDISLFLDWQPNDRIIGIIQAEQGEAINRRSYDYQLNMETVHTTKQTLAIDDLLSLSKDTKMKKIAATYSKVSKLSTLAAVAAQNLQERGSVAVMHIRPDWVWALADKFKIAENRQKLTDKTKLVQEFLKLEFGDEFPLVDLLAHGVGVHHAGLSDEVRILMERLFEEDELRFLVATTTIAHGVNFPISGVVMASHQYPYGEDMPPEDFWNIAGRTGRIGQESLGVVAFVAENQEKANILQEFINKQSGELNSALITLAQKAGDLLNDLGNIVYNLPEWSSFVQYLAHTYRQMGHPEGFVNDIEQVLRNTFGFEKLRAEDSTLANRLLNGVRSYTENLQEPGQPIKLVDSTGFSLESIKAVLNEVAQVGIGRDTWNADSLFSQEDQNLQAMMGVLLRVPELRENLKAVIGGRQPDGDKLALIVKDWVNGASIKDIAERYFMGRSGDVTDAMTKCGQNLFGRLTQTTAWGLGALLSITGSDMPEDQMHTLNNLPSRVYYGVNDDAAIALRLLGIPRSAATRLADSMGDVLDEPLSNVRSRLRNMDEANWWQALGEREGEIYRKVWRMLEGLD